jgi:hypothetical protein
MKIINSSLEVHGKDEPHQAEIMIAVQVTYENMVDTVKIDLQAHELHLRSFTAVNKKMPVLYFHQLRCGMPPVSGHGAA